MRKEEIYNGAVKILKEGRNPSAQELSRYSDFPIQDVHRCLNALEKEGRLRTYPKKVIGRKIRIVSF